MTVTTNRSHARPQVGVPVRSAVGPGPSRQWYGLAVIIALAGLIAGGWFGIVNYRSAQRHIDTFNRVSIPGTMILELPSPTGRVLYYEGDRRVRYEDLKLTITGPDGNTVPIHRYQGELVYETIGLDQGRAVATFDASRAGGYRIQVSGVASGQLVVGDSFAHRALPAVLMGLGIAAFGLGSGFALWMVTFVRRSGRESARQARP